VVKYLKNDTPITNPAIVVVASDGSGGSPTSITLDTDTIYDSITLVQVQITSINNSNQIGLNIPGLSLSVPVPPIVTTLPSESLGRTSSSNTGLTRSCTFP